MVECPWAVVLWWAQRFVDDGRYSLEKSGSCLGLGGPFLFDETFTCDKEYYINRYKHIICDSLQGDICMVLDG